MEEHIYDVLVIGAGPAGLSAGIVAKSKKLDVLVLEAQRSGGQMTALYPRKPVGSHPLLSGYTAGELARRMLEDSFKQGVRVEEGAMVERLEKEDDLFVLTTSDGRKFKGRAVIIAIGMGKMKPRRLGVDNEEKFEGKGLYYSVKDPEHFRGKEVVIAGGGDAAVDNALLLRAFGANVTLVHRRKEFKAQPTTVARLEPEGVKLLLKHRIVALEGRERLEAVIVEDLNTGRKKRIATDALIVNFGLIPTPGPAASWGLEMDGNFIVVDTEMKTSREGIFACGDGVSYPGKLRLVATAIAEATVAVNSVYRYLRRKKARTA